MCRVSVLTVLGLQKSCHIMFPVQTRPAIGGRGGGRTRYINACGRSRMTIVVCGVTLASLQCRDGACRVLTDEADIACTKREAP